MNKGYMKREPYSNNLNSFGILVAANPHLIIPGNVPHCPTHHESTKTTRDTPSSFRIPLKKNTPDITAEIPTTKRRNSNGQIINDVHLAPFTVTDDPAICAVQTTLFFLSADSHQHQSTC